MKKLLFLLFAVSCFAADPLFVSVGGLDVPARPLELSTAINRATAPLVYGGLGNAPDASWQGKIVLLDRGVPPGLASFSFLDKIKAAQAAGGVACVIANNVSGPFTGSIGTGNSSAFPAVTVSLEDGAKLRALPNPVATVSPGVTLPALPLGAHAGELLGTDGNGWIFVKRPPQISVISAGTTANVNESVTLVATADGSPAPSFQWSKDGAPIDGATAASLTLPSVQLTDAGKYTVTAANSAGSLASQSFTLAVNGASP